LNQHAVGTGQAPPSVGQRLARLPRAATAWRQAPVTKRIANTIFVVGAATLLLKVASAGRELTVAYHLGTSDAIDAFVIAFLAPSFVISAPIAAFVDAVTPTFIRVREREGEAAAARLAANALAAALVLLLASVLLLALLSGPIVGLLGSGFSAEKSALTLRLFHLLLPVVVLQGVCLLWGGLINCVRRFALVALVPLATPLLSVALLLAFEERLGVDALVAGAVGGAALELALLAAGARRLGLPCRPRWHGLDAPSRAVAGYYLPAVLGSLMASGATLVDQAMAAMLDPGSVARLSYGVKLIAFALSLSAAPLATAIFPHVAELLARGDRREVRRTCLGWAGLVFAIGVPTAGLIALLSAPIVRLVFERGAFTAADTAAVAPILACYALQIPFYLAGIIGARILGALCHYRALALISTSNFVLNIVLNLLLLRLLGLPGIALATSLVYVTSSVMIAFLVWPHLSERREGGAAPAARVPAPP